MLQLMYNPSDTLIDLIDIINLISINIYYTEYITKEYRFDINDVQWY